MKIFKILLVIIITPVLIFGSYIVWQANRTIVVVINTRSQEFENVKIEAFGQTKIIPILSVDSHKKLLFTGVSGESGIRMNLNGNVWKGGYIEPGYHVSVTISDAGIVSKDIPIYKLMFGLY